MEVDDKLEGEPPFMIGTIHGGSTYSFDDIRNLRECGLLCHMLLHSNKSCFIDFGLLNMSYGQVIQIFRMIFYRSLTIVIMALAVVPDSKGQVDIFIDVGLRSPQCHPLLSHFMLVGGDGGQKLRVSRQFPLHWTSGSVIMSSAFCQFARI